MIKGTVKFFNDAKGFGFIAPDDGGKDVFLPAATITASGAARLKAGQRVSFVPEPDVKGPKAVQLTVLEEAPRPAPAPVQRIGVTVYHHPDSSDSQTVLAALSAEGFTPRLVDCAATPPARDELKRLSLLLREADQTLVRRYDPLFFELQLDDRFISDGDFWTAIHEHPSLINGPVLLTANKARICRTAADVRAFLGIGAAAVPQKPKTISPRLAAMIAGMPVPEEPESEPGKAPEPAARAAAKPNPQPKEKPPAAKPEAAPKAVVPKTAAKPKAAAKAPAKKPPAKPKAKPPAKKKKK